MPTVTYHNQPAIHKTGAHIGIEGTKHPYTVSKILWTSAVEAWIQKQLIGRTLHVCCGKSMLGDCRLDINESSADIVGDATCLPFASQSWDTVLIDPSYNGVFQWNHDMLSELGRVARKRIVFQHWFLPIDTRGRFKKTHRFRFTDAAIWQPKTYFGRVQVITVMDEVQSILL